MRVLQFFNSYILKKLIWLRATARFSLKRKATANSIVPWRRIPPVAEEMRLLYMHPVTRWRAEGGKGTERRDVGTRGTAARSSQRGREEGIRRLARALLEALK